MAGKSPDILRLLGEEKCFLQGGGSQESMELMPCLRAIGGWGEPEEQHTAHLLFSSVSSFFPSCWAQTSHGRHWRDLLPTSRNTGRGTLGAAPSIRASFAARDFPVPPGAHPDPTVTQTLSSTPGSREVPKVALRWEKISMSCSKLQNFSLNLPLPRIPLDSLMDNTVRYLKCHQNPSWNKSQTSLLINTSGHKTTQTNSRLFQIINHL